jgi:hypothetical protein
MSSQLRELLRHVEVTAPQRAGALQVFGLRWQAGNGLRYSTLDDALAAQALEVTEITDGGSVPTLKVTNKGDVMVFLMAGEQLIGAKQNRVLNASLLVPGKTELPVPVSCVEAGRWRYQSQKFASGQTMSHGSLRKMMSKHAHDGYREHGTPTSDQSRVWGEVSRKLDSMHSLSPSKALHQAYEDHRQRLDDVMAQVHAPAEASGVAFVLDGKVAGVDLFDQPETLTKLWPKLVRAYVLDALEISEQTTAEVAPEQVATWLQTAAEASAEPYPSPGVGVDVRLEGVGVVGAGLVVEEHPVHVELFTREEAK